ncbi:FadR family transcriptional regulator [Parahaliea maris]|uniref:FadR family transcriptional regulator n=1 Tax=Parahaliea maris TaxID=2716870 RepID=A0A5C8ZX38_9GAMM|nr:FadR/GntR family transcriptional regulator [Parahaliea maris]TXS92130.1 FadR family transcriptional regulator [Parahaliea maris]
MNKAVSRRPESPQPQTMVQSVIADVLRHIHERQLKVGDTVPSEGEFGQQLGVSRTVMREAFKALAAMNIIEVHAGRKARVKAFDSTLMALTLSHGLHTEQLTVQQLWDVRRSMEMRTVVLACMHRSEAVAAALLELTERMRATHNDVAAMTEHDIAFHEEIAKATRNPLFPVLVSSLTQAMRETNPIVWRSRTRSEEQLKVVDWHRDIAEAIRDQDPGRAMEAMSLHFDEALRGLVLSGFN